MDNGPDERTNAHFPAKLQTAENELIRERRKLCGLAFPGWAAHESETPPNRVGLALSGGGIRSATISLGILQALARHDLLKRIDYLSTVSGGGYIGVFLGALFTRWRHEANDPVGNHERVKEALCVTSLSTGLNVAASARSGAACMPAREHAPAGPGVG